MPKTSYHVRHRNGVTVDWTADLSAARAAARVEHAQLFTVVDGKQFLTALPSPGGSDDGNGQESK